MSNLVERLREGADPCDIPDAERVMDAAANEIERLQAKLDQIAVMCSDNKGPRCNHRMALDFARQIAEAKP